MSAVYYGDIKNTDAGEATFFPATRTATANGAAVDLLAGDGNNANALLQVGAMDIASGDETYAWKIQESSDDGVLDPYADILGATFTSKSAVLASTPNFHEWIFFKRTKRYCRAVFTAGGTTPSTAFSIEFVERRKITGSGTGFFSAT